MSTVKRHLQTDPTLNSLLDDSLSDAHSNRSAEVGSGVAAMKNKYRHEFLAYRAEQEAKLKQKVMRLDYVIRNAVEITQIIDRLA